MAQVKVYQKTGTVEEMYFSTPIEAVVSASRTILIGDNKCNIPHIRFSFKDNLARSYVVADLSFLEVTDLRCELQEIEKYEFGEKSKKYV